MNQNEWIQCPVCGNKTRDRIREDTVLKNYPLYCPKCKQETLIETENCLQYREYHKAYKQTKPKKQEKYAERYRTELALYDRAEK